MAWPRGKAVFTSFEAAFTCLASNRHKEDSADAMVGLLVKVDDNAFSQLIARSHE
jgi:hypothetical protein